MSIQNVQGSSVEGTLRLSWILLEDCEGISIQVARDLEFTNTLRMFILPKCTACHLDAGKGLWFFRVGMMKKSKIEWMGTPPPIYIHSDKDPPQISPPPLKVISTQPLTGGLRLNTDSQIPSYSVLEYSEKGFHASSTKTTYFIDPARSYFDCEGLQAGHTYKVRLATPSTPRLLPTNTVDTLSDWLVFTGKQALPFLKPHDASDNAQRRSDAVILKEVNESKKPIRFGSQSEYLKYLIAKTKNTGGKA